MTGPRPAPPQAQNIDPGVREMLALRVPPPPRSRHKSYFEGTGKFGWRDAVRVLGALGDPAQAAALAEGRRNALESARQANMSYAQLQKVAQLPGMTPREFQAYMENPEQWGAQMADAFASRHAAVNMNQTDTRVFGDPTQGGHTYRPPQTFDNGADRVEYDPQSGRSSTVHQGTTPGEQYARSLGLQPGSQDWNKAVQDAELGGSGPTAFGFDQQLEAARQRNRMQQRSTPTYRDLNPPPPRSRSSGGSSGPTATGPNGEKIRWNGSAWVPVR